MRRISINEIIAVIIILAIAGAFLLYDIDSSHGVWRNRTFIGYQVLLQQYARELHSLYKAADILSDNYLITPGHVAYNVFIEGMGMTSSIFFANIISTVSELSVKNLRLFCSAIGLMSVFFTYCLARYIYDIKAALISSSLLGSSLFFVLMTRQSLVTYPYPLETFLAIVTIFLFAAAHKTLNSRFLLFAGISLGLCWINSITAPFFLLAPFIIISFLVISHFMKICLFEKIMYLKMVLISFTVCLVLSSMYSAYLYASPFEIFFRLNSYLASRGGESFAYNISNISNNLLRFFRILFTSNVQPYSDGFGIHHWPFITSLAAISFLAGTVKLIKSRQMQDILLLIWVFVPVLIFTFMSYFEARYLNSIIPGFYIISAQGILFVSAKIQNNKKFSLNKTIVIISVIIIMHSIFSTAYAYFVDYRNNDSYASVGFGQIDAGDYIYRNASPQNSFVVLGDEETVPEEMFVFATRGEPYQHAFWSTLSSSKIDMHEWEAEILRTKQNIYYIFSHGSEFVNSPYLKFAEPFNWSDFKTIHPDASPVKTVNSSSGMPVLSIYKITGDAAHDNENVGNIANIHKQYVAALKNGKFRAWNSNHEPDAWQLNGAEIIYRKKYYFIADDSPPVRISTKNSGGRLEQVLTDIEQLKGKYVTLKALVRRENNASVSISLHDGITETASNATGALGHFQTVTLIKRLDQNATKLGVYLSINAINSTACFDNIQLYEGY